MAKEKREHTRYDLPLDYFEDHVIYSHFYERLIPELSTLHHTNGGEVNIEDIFNDAKVYVDMVITSKHPELELSKADQEIKEGYFLHQPSNSYYSHIVRSLFYIVVFISTTRTEAMRQALSWVYDNIKSDGYTYSEKDHRGSLANTLIYKFNPKCSEFDKGYNTKIITINSAMYDLDREYKDEVQYFGLILATEAPILTRIVQGDTDTKKDNRQKLPLSQDIVLETLKQLCIKAGYKPDESNNRDFVKFCCLITPYSENRVSSRYKFEEGQSLIEDADKAEVKELKALSEKLGIDLEIG